MSALHDWTRIIPRYLDRYLDTYLHLQYTLTNGKRNWGNLMLHSCCKIDGWLFSVSSQWLSLVKCVRHPLLLIVRIFGINFATYGQNRSLVTGCLFRKAKEIDYTSQADLASKQEPATSSFQRRGFPPALDIDLTAQWYLCPIQIEMIYWHCIPCPNDQRKWNMKITPRQSAHRSAFPVAECSKNTCRMPFRGDHQSGVFPTPGLYLHGLISS